MGTLAPQARLLVNGALFAVRVLGLRRMAWMERTPVMADALLLLKTLCSLSYGSDPAVQSALGVELTCRSTRPAGSPGLAVAPLERDERCDVAIVGSGAGGAAAARVLAAHGLDVIVLEAGEHHDAASYSTDPLASLSTLYRDSGMVFCEGRPTIPMPVGRCVGGTTVINSGTMLRPAPSVLERWRDELGIEWATELDLAGVERDLGVEPVDPAVAGRNAELCRIGADAIGARNGPLPRNAPGVECCGTCPLGCAIDAKRAVHVTELPVAVESGARVLTGASARRIEGTDVLCEGGHRVSARAVVLAGGALGTPELLLRQGLGNAEVGRHLHIHPACWVGALYPDEVRGWDGVMQSWHVDEWAQRGLFLEATFTPLPFGAHWLPGVGAEYRERLAAYARLGVIGVHLSERQSEGRVRVSGGRTRVGYKVVEDDAAAIRFGIARAAQIHFAAGATEVYPQIRGIPVLRPGEETELIERASIPASRLRLEAFHPMGTARLGGATSVDGELKGAPGVWVADASLLPTSLGANPMVTIMACARQVAGHVTESL